MQVLASSEAEADTTAGSLDAGGHLDQTEGGPLGELCRNDSCGDLLDGDGYEGECGNCAARRYAHDEGEHQDEPDDACASGD